MERVNWQIFQRELIDLDTQFKPVEISSILAERYPNSFPVPPTTDQVTSALRRIREAQNKDEPRPPAPRVGPDFFQGFSIGFFDIETTFSTQPRVLYAAVADAWGNIKEYDRDKYPGTNRLYDDRELVEAYVTDLRDYDILVSWNGKLFDTPVLNGRLAFHNSEIKRLDPNMHVDLMYYASGQFMRIGRRSLESVSKYFGTDNKKTPLDVTTWDQATSGNDEAYQEIKDHCNADVLVLRDVFSKVKAQIRNIHR